MSGDAGRGRDGDAGMDSIQRLTVGEAASRAWNFLRPSVCEWACLAAGLFLTVHYMWLYDDAFVYFRYVDNFLFLGFGLVYNQGEYAEGYSSPLWAMVLIALRSLRLSFWPIVLALGCLSFLVYWLMLLVLNRWILGDRRGAINLPLCYTTFVYGVGAYFTSGLESPLIHLAAVGYALLIFRPSARVPIFVAAVSPLIRPELALPLVLATAWCWFRLRRFPALLIGLALAFNLAWLAFRVYYYADFLPVTFYLKNIVDVRQGLIYLHNTLGVYHTYELAALMALVFAWLRIGARPGEPAFAAERVMILLVAASVAAYVVKIGGNAQHFRYLSFSFCLGVCAFAGIPEWALDRLAAQPAGARFGAFGSAARFGRGLPAGVLLGAGLAALGFVGYPPQVSHHPFFAGAKSEWVDKIYDSWWHRHEDPFARNLSEGWDQMDLYQVFLDEDPARAYRGVEAGFWCGDNFRRFHLRIIHSLGLTDPILARTIMPSDRPSHKFGLIPLSEQMRDVQREFTWAPGVYRRAVEAGRAPAWIANNLESIEAIEAKSRNTHGFVENLRLALKRIPPIDPTRGAVGAGALP